MSLPVDTKNLHRSSGSAPPMPRRASSASTASTARSRRPDLKNDLVAAAGVHDASPAVVALARTPRRQPRSRRPARRCRRVDRAAPDCRRRSRRSIASHARDRSSHVRQEAAEALGDLAMPEAATALIALARSLTDIDARREAVEALGARPELEAPDALASIARNDASSTSSAKPWKRSATSRTSAASCC